MTDKKKRIGRPPKRPQAGTRVSLGLKVTPRIKAKLDAVARASGRTQSQEAERLLEQSFSEEEAFGGMELRRIAVLMAASFFMAGRASEPDLTPGEWIKVPSAYINAMDGVLRALMLGLPSEHRALAGQAMIGSMQTLLVNERRKK